MSLNDDVAILARLAIFSEIDPVRLQVLAFTCERIVCAPGETLFEEGDDAPSAFVITEGEAVMLANGIDGEAQVARLDAGDLIGESALLLDGKRRSTVRAVGEMEVMVIRRALFMRLLSEFPEMVTGLARSAAGRLSALQDDMGVLQGQIDGRRAGRLGEG